MTAYLCRVHVHLVWATHRRQAMLTGGVEPVVHEMIINETRRRGCHVLAIGGIEEHVHLLVWLHPSCSIADLVAVTKAVSSRTVHATLRRPFRWQRGYGAFAVQPRALDDVVDYVRRQPEHHARGTTLEVLEHTGADEVPSRP